MLTEQWLGYRRSMAAPAYESDIAPVAALLADQARAAMLLALIPGRPLAAGELAEVAHVSAPTASAHLAKLLDGGLLTVSRQGRHRYYGLASYQVAEVVEQIALIGRDIPVHSLRQSKQAQALAAARTCYDHLAGRAGVDLLDGLLRTGVVKDTGQPTESPWPEALSSPGRMVLEVTAAGEETLASFGIEVDELRRGRRRFAGACLDWTERRAHLSGALGAAITQRLFELGWIERGPRARSVNLTTDGRSGLADTFDWTG
jgi:DNA-binding transcriptional ArsR family regulator